MRIDQGKSWGGPGGCMYTCERSSSRLPLYYYQITIIGIKQLPWGPAPQRRAGRAKPSPAVPASEGRRRSCIRSSLEHVSSPHVSSYVERSKTKERAAAGAGPSVLAGRWAVGTGPWASVCVPATARMYPPHLRPCESNVALVLGISHVFFWNSNFSP